jgi:hypothetical protein
MGQYSLIISEEAKRDLQYWHKVGEKSVIRKIDRIFKELALHPKTGIETTLRSLVTVSASTGQILMRTSAQKECCMESPHKDQKGEYRHKHHGNKNQIDIWRLSPQRVIGRYRGDLRG